MTPSPLCASCPRRVRTEPHFQTDCPKCHKRVQIKRVTRRPDVGRLARTYFVAECAACGYSAEVVDLPGKTEAQ